MKKSLRSALAARGATAHPIVGQREFLSFADVDSGEKARAALLAEQEKP